MPTFPYILRPGPLVGKLEPSADARKMASCWPGSPPVFRRWPPSEGSGRRARFSEEGDPNHPSAFLVGEVFRPAVKFRGSLESLSCRGRPAKDEQPLPLVLPEPPLAE